MIKCTETMPKNFIYYSMGRCSCRNRFPSRNQFHKRNLFIIGNRFHQRNRVLSHQFLFQMAKGLAIHNSSFWGIDTALVQTKKSSWVLYTAKSQVGNRCENDLSRRESEVEHLLVRRFAFSSRLSTGAGVNIKLASHFSAKGLTRTKVERFHGGI